MRSVFSEEKKLSIVALPSADHSIERCSTEPLIGYAQTFPDRLIEQMTPLSTISRWNCSPDLFAVMFDRLDAKGGGYVRLAGPGSTDQHNIVGAVHKLATVQLPDQSFIHLVEARRQAIMPLIPRPRLLSEANGVARTERLSENPLPQPGQPANLHLLK